MKQARTAYLTAIVQAALLALSPLALANDNIDDYWPADTALTDCGETYVRDSVAPTVSGAQARCAAALERRLKVAATMARLSTPRMGGPTPEWEEQAKIAVAKKRAMISEDFAKRVAGWIADKRH